MKYKLRKQYSTDAEVALGEILVDRGVEDLESFLRPGSYCEINPHNLSNIDAAANMLIYHLQHKSKILILQDCDVDGITSASIIWLYIKRAVPDIELQFLVHSHKQHGLDDSIDYIEEKISCNLIIVPDAGSYDVEEHQRLSDAGIDCIVLDHHNQEYDAQGQPIKSKALRTVVVNNQLSKDYPNKSLCGAGVVYKFCEVMDEYLGVNWAHDYIDLVALGEIADVMDRTNSETNYLMIEGLRNIHNEGFRTLLESQSFSLKNKAVAPYIGLTPTDIAFYIAPLLNAITRVGTLEEKQTAFYCFVDPMREVPSTKRGAKPGDTEFAAEQAARIGKNAKARQDRIKEQALEIIDARIRKNGLDENNIIIVEVDSYDNIPTELTGLVAMNIVSKYHKPTIIGRKNENGEFQGSLRSDGNFEGLPSFKQFLEDSKLVSYVAGHDSAAGVGISENKIQSLLDYGNTNLNKKDFEQCYIVDYILDGSLHNESLIRSLASHPEYFGNHIDEIKIVVKNIALTNIMLMGANKDSTKISYNGIDYVRFKDGDFADAVSFSKDKLLTVYGRANLNEYMGKVSIQIFIDDYEIEEPAYDSKYDF